MKEHEERLRLEHTQLVTKTVLLNRFIYSNAIFQTLDKLEQLRMVKQVGFMEAYADVLATRIRYNKNMGASVV